MYLELTNVSTWLEAGPSLNLGFEPCPIALVCTYWGTELAHIVLFSHNPVSMPRYSFEHSCDHIERQEAYLAKNHQLSDFKRK